MASAGYYNCKSITLTMASQSLISEVAGSNPGLNISSVLESLNFGKHTSAKEINVSALKLLIHNYACCYSFMA